MTTTARSTTARWWLGAAVGAVVTAVVLAVLSLWIPAMTATALGWLAFALPGPAVTTRSPAWRADAPVSLALLSVTLIGVGLVIGAFWTATGHLDLVPLSLALGGVLSVGGSSLSLVRARRFSRREVDAEVERNRAEQRMLDAADDPA
jgi:hypothetical protein